MTASPKCQRDPFFLDYDGRRLFAVFHPPVAVSETEGGAVFFAPFAEELNRTRRMATLLAEALSAAGIGTLIFDYSCTGDSAGMFGESRWDYWIDDGVAAIEWMVDRLGAPVTLVGLRLGASISLQSAQKCTDQINQFVFWQPVTSGRNLLTQFLRIRIAAALGDAENRETTATLRERFASGDTVEVGGYSLAPGLVRGLEEVSLAATPPLKITPTTWFEISPNDDAELIPASETVISRWRDSGASVAASTIRGDQFWATQEMTVAPALIDATLAAIVENRP